MQYLLSLSGVGQLDESNIAINLTFSLRKLAFRLGNWPISPENGLFSVHNLICHRDLFSLENGEVFFRPWLKKFKWKWGKFFPEFFWKLALARRRAFFRWKTGVQIKQYYCNSCCVGRQYLISIFAELQINLYPNPYSVRRRKMPRGVPRFVDSDKGLVHYLPVDQHPFGHSFGDPS